MAAPDVEKPVAAPGVPDYLSSPNAVFSDADVKWRYGRAPDYSKTRKVWAEGKRSKHAAGSLEEMVENLVKNWEVEASFKPRLSDWRTIDHENYSFAMNGGPPQTAEHMLKVGTYNAIIAPNEYYSPVNSDFDSSHKTFKRMMPTFAWEVLEVYSGPPKVAFRWRHWGQMKNDYVGFNDKGEKVVVKAHGGPIDITGVTVATVDDQVRLQKVDTYYDPLEMFRQIAPNGIVNKTIMNRKVAPSDALESSPNSEPIKSDAAAPTISPVTSDAATIQSPTAAASAEKDDPFTFSEVESAQALVEQAASQAAASSSINSSAVNGNETHRLAQSSQPDYSKDTGTYDHIDKHLEKPAEQVHPHPKDMEDQVKPEAGEGIAVPANSTEAKMTHEEMSRLAKGECPFLMNRE